jgi:hypothetical protein
MFQTIRFWGYALVVVGFSIVVGCGDESKLDRLAGSELLQDVRLTQYHIRKAKWNIEARYGENNDSLDKLSKEVNFPKNMAKDNVKRVFEDGRFFVVVNDQKAQINIAPDGAMRYEQKTEQSVSGCSLFGESHISGQADHLRIRMNWKLQGRLNGKGCPTEIRTHFSEFIYAELERLNLTVAGDLLAGLDQEVGQAQELKLDLSLEGEIDPDDLPTASSFSFDEVE